MSERNFFNIRYALPGYTFILIVILIAFPSLIETVKSFNEANMDFTIVSALLAFLTLLSGSAIGFLISQFWYFFHNYVLKNYSLKQTREYLRETFNLREDTHQENVFLDYVFHNFSEGPRLAYVGRRFDLIHTLASTIFAVIFGVIFGIIVKTDYLSINTNFTTEFEIIFPIFTMYDVGLIVTISLLLLVLLHGFFFISKEYSLIVKSAITEIIESNKDNFTQDKLDKIFSKNYFKKKA